MKKRIFAAILAMLLVVSWIPTAAVAAEHTHEGHTHVEKLPVEDGHGPIHTHDACTHENVNWIHNENNHHVSACADCGVRLTEWEDHQLVDGVCSICGAQPCADNAHVSDEHHVCTLCGAQTYCVNKDGDCACDVCGGVVHTWGYGYDETNHWEECAVCGEVLSEPWPHEGVEESGYCHFCSYGCDHSDGHYDYNDEEHAFYCFICQKEVNREPHEFDADGYCICGKKYCAHENWHWSFDSFGHIEVCDDCGEGFGGWESHEYDADGYCICGKKYCAHENWHWSFDSVEHIEVCDDCGDWFGGWESHELDGDGYCTVCGYYDCPHTNWHWYTDAVDHLKECDDCGEWITGWEPHQFDENEVCIVCGYFICQHENVAWVHHEDGTHYSYCADCDEMMTSWEPHRLNWEGVCDICGAKPCLEGEHVSGADHICTLCGCWTYCVDENSDCICDICGDSLHVFITRHDDTQHWQQCVYCGHCEAYGEHYLDGRGICGAYGCGYGCDHPAEAVIWWVHSDWHMVGCRICYGFIGELEYHDFQWEYDNDSHRIRCTVCHVTELDWSHHNFDIQGVCTDCGAQPCPDGEHVSDEHHICTLCGCITYCQDADGDCACDICGEVQHETGWERNDTQHRRICRDCGEILGDWEDHWGVDDWGFCRECGYGCEHYSTGYGYADDIIGQHIVFCYDCEQELYWEDCNIQWMQDREYHEGYCVDCDRWVVSWSRHEFENDICIVCGYERCTHPNTGWYADNQDHILICLDCDEWVGEWEKHTLVDGVCTICDFEPCTHPNAFWAYTENEHVYGCMDCGETITNVERHTFKDGVCTVCGAKPCAKEDHVVDGEHVCTLCGCIILECRDFNGDCCCDYCGNEMHIWSWESNETGHRRVCAVCGQVVMDWESHFGIEYDGYCWDCGYGCDHTSTECWYENEEYHAVSCAECGNLLSLEKHDAQWFHYEDGTHILWCGACGTEMTAWEPHTLVNGVCTVCGAKPCADGEHVSDAHHYCINCGCGMGCEDENEDCICDVCGEEHHTNIAIVCDEDYHWVECMNCGMLMTEKFEHEGMDDDGICDACGYGCSHEHAEWFSYDAYSHTYECEDCGMLLAQAVHELEWYHDEAGNHIYGCQVCGMEKYRVTEEDCPLCDEEQNPGGDPEYVLGDVNGDGRINVLDAGLIVSYYTGVKDLDETQQLVADVNGDGKINVLDAGLIVSFYTGVITTFPAEQ